MVKPFQRARRRLRRRKSQRRPINVLASVLTTFSLYCGIASIFASINMEYEKAAYWILGAIVFDILDGTVARITKSESAFGKELDSLSDVVSFGVAPAVLIYTAYLLEERQTGSLIGTTGSMMAIVFVICGALRLARYNVYQSERHDVFIGLPIPAAAGNVASFSLFMHYFDVNVAFWVFGPFTLALAFLMVSTIPFPKEIQRFVVAPKHAFRMLVLCVVGIAVFHYARQYSTAIVWMPLGMSYVLYGLANEAYRKTFRKAPTRARDRSGLASKEPQQGSSAIPLGTPQETPAPK